MATSINNSGVTFPDNTTQTTAAAGSPVTLLYSGGLSGNSTTVNGVFSTTYNSYILTFAKLPGATSYANVQYYIRFLVDGSVISTTSYYIIAPSPTGADRISLTSSPNYGDTSKVSGATLTMNSTPYYYPGIGGVISSTSGSLLWQFSTGSGSYLTGFQIYQSYAPGAISMDSAGATYRLFTYGN
jgi:hypothetical protein